jgi:rhodanese-related sulfurtransferase
LDELFFPFFPLQALEISQNGQRNPWKNLANPSDSLEIFGKSLRPACRPGRRDTLESLDFDPPLQRQERILKAVSIPETRAMPAASPIPPQAGGGLVTHEELEAALDADACVLVDVREPHEFAAGHIPGAISLPLSRFDPAELPEGKPIVLVCQAGARSARALNTAMGAGIKDIRHYAPGTGGWRARGGALEI